MYWNQIWNLQLFFKPNFSYRIGSLVWRVGEGEGDADALPLDALGLGRDQVEVEALDGNGHDGVDGHVEVVVLAFQLDLYISQ